MFSLAFAGSEYVSPLSQEEVRLRVTLNAILDQYDPRSTLILHAFGQGERLIAWLAHERGFRVHGVLPVGRTYAGKAAGDFSHYADTWTALTGRPSEMTRYLKLVGMANRLVAICWHAEDDPHARHTNTLRAIRYARKRGIPVEVLILSTLGVAA